MPLLDFDLYGIKTAMLYWNGAFPVDLWWRKKYNIAFGSEKHKQTSYPMQLWEFLEEEAMKKSAEEYQQRIKESPEEKELFDSLGFNKKQVIKMTQDDIDDAFEDIDLENFN